LKDLPFWPKGTSMIKLSEGIRVLDDGVVSEVVDLRRGVRW
jgi:hypothetical protein